MKITSSQLRRIIREEASRVLREAASDVKTVINFTRKLTVKEFVSKLDSLPVDMPVLVQDPSGEAVIIEFTGGVNRLKLDRGGNMLFPVSSQGGYAVCINGGKDVRMESHVGMSVGQLLDSIEGFAYDAAGEGDKMPVAVRISYGDPCTPPKSVKVVDMDGETCAIIQL